MQISAAQEGEIKMTGYRMEKTTMGRKIYVRMSRQEIVERRILTALICTSPFLICWLFAIAARMV